MKKRLLCLFLCVVMLLSVVLTGCNKKDDEQATEDISQDASSTATTLSMWVVSEEPVSAQTAELINAEINKITKTKFRTQLVIQFFTEDEYRDKLEEAILAYQAANGSKPVETEPVEGDEEATGSEGSTVVTEETYVNEDGVSIIKYPDLLENQVDILYIGGKNGVGEDMYFDFIDNGWLAPLDDALENTSKQIREYISTALMAAAKHQGTTYAIPNNRTIGEYKYMLLNKELMQRYRFNAYVETGKIDGFFNDTMYSFLNLMYLYESDVIPVDADYTECLDMLAHYWYVDADSYEVLNKFSMFGYYYQNIEEINRGSVVLGCESLFENPEFTEDYLKLSEFRLKDYFPKAEENRTKAAVKFVTGDASVLEDNEYVIDGVAYYPIVVGYPTISSEDIYANMFGVCKNTVSVSRSMQIITYLNTSADFRNLLQYGVENEHYELIEDPEKGTVVNPLNNDYVMDIYATGNTFIAYRDKNMSADIWETGKVQNRSALVSPLLGFNFSEFAATTGTTSSSVSIDKSLGYNLSYTTGYSKEILKQNALLKAWIEECDAAETKGVYVLKTSVASGSNVSYNYYVYNNNTGNSKVNFSVKELREASLTTSEKGKITETQTNLDFTLNYSLKSGTSKTPGYELSIVNVYTNKKNTFDLLAKMDGASVDVFVKDQNAAIELDFNKSSTYTVEVYDKISKPAIMNNYTLISWIENCDKNGDLNPTTYVMKYEETVDNKKVYTYVVYRTALTLVTDLTVLPLGTENKLDLTFNFTDTKDSKLDTSEGAAEANYLLCYVRVTADKNVTVKDIYTTGQREVSNAKTETSVTNTVTGAVQTEKSLSSSYIETVNTDPDFRVHGNLDTEMLKVMQKANDALTKVLDLEFKDYYDAYHAVLNNGSATAVDKQIAFDKAMDDMRKLIGDLAKLLTTTANGEADFFEPGIYPILYNINLTNKVSLYLPFLAADDKLTKDVNERTTSKLTVFRRYVQGITSYEPIMFEEDCPYKGDSFVYRDSVYGIYYKWLQTYDYLPKTTTTN